MLTDDELVIDAREKLPPLSYCESDSDTFEPFPCSLLTLLDVELSVSTDRVVEVP